MRLLGITFIYVFFLSNQAIAGPEFGLSCIQTMFETRNQYLDVRKGDVLPEREIVFYFSDNGLETTLQTNLWFVGKNIQHAEISKASIEVLTEIYSDFFSIVTFNRYSGEVSVVRHHSSDDTRVEIWLFQCRKSEAAF